MGPVDDPLRVRNALPSWLVGADAHAVGESLDAHALGEALDAPPRRPVHAHEHAHVPARERRWAVLSAAALGALVLGTLWLGSGTPAVAVPSEPARQLLSDGRDPSLPVAADVLAGLPEVQPEELPPPTF
jgi:hypothetical protein